MTVHRARAGRWVAAAVLLGSSAGTAGLAAQDAPQVAAEAKALAAAREVAEAARFCSLITLDSSGHPRARIMDPFPPEEDFTVWLATNSRTRKVEQLESDGRATLFYFDREGAGYLTLLGTAEVVRDPAEKARRWKDTWSDFYEDGHRGEDFVLIRFRPDRLEVMSIAHDVASDPKGWKPAIIELGPRP